MLTCELKKHEGTSHCEGELPQKGKRYYFSANDGMCLPFFYLGCGGNVNNFKNRRLCEKACMEIEEDISK